MHAVPLKDHSPFTFGFHTFQLALAKRNYDISAEFSVIKLTAQF